MVEALREVGKGLIVFANMLMILIFFKKFDETDNLAYFWLGVYFGFVWYVVGFVLILISKKFEKE